MSLYVGEILELSKLHTDTNRDWIWTKRLSFHLYTTFDLDLSRKFKIPGEAFCDPDFVHNGVQTCLKDHDGVKASKSYNTCIAKEEGSCRGGCEVTITCEDGFIYTVGGKCISKSANTGKSEKSIGRD